MESLLQKFRGLLEAWWAASPSVVGLACITLDLAALLHLRLQSRPATARAYARRPESNRGYSTQE